MSNPAPSVSGDLSVICDDESRQRFERLALPHLDAACNLARWLIRDDHDAHAVVEKALLHALRHVHELRAEGARAWLLQIVRRTCRSWPGQRRAVGADESPLARAGEAGEAQVNAALAGLPVVYREVLVLRELEDLSYADIARIVDVPVVTVLSRLSRARALMRATLTRPSPQRMTGTGLAATAVDCAWLP